MINSLFKKNYTENKLGKSRPVSNGTRVLSYILISLIIAVNFLAPISVGVNQNKVEIKKQVASAGDGGIKMTVVPGSSSTEIKLIINVTWSILSGTKEGVRVILKDTTGVEADQETIVNMETVKGNTQTGSVFFEKLTPNKQYSVITEARQIAGLQIKASWSKFLTINPNAILPDNLGLWEIKGEDYDYYEKEGSIWNLIIDTTNESTRTQTESKTLLVGKEQTSQNMQFDDTMPACDILGDNGTFMGCIAQGFYYVLFVPTSYLFALAGIFFDNTFAYSVNDSSYKSSFVVQGWGLVRDFCNMFFIFIMLYVAIGTILSLHSMKTKETIVNVVIIGLFINFSLFATQVIIDASNITARVFYNSDAIKITQKGQSDNTLKNATDGGTILAEETISGVIPLSAALVNKVNPQNIIINSKKVNAITVKGGGGAIAGEDKGNIGVGSFILIVLLASAVNIVGLIVFLSVGLIFVSRVIGLWLAMILAPLAFFTYILPEMAGTKMIGWKNWWPETLKLAFLAPVFIFFLYIILKFLELDIITDIVNKGGLDFFVATLIPFAFIMILILKAKSIASEMSGEMGQKITGGVAAAGGMLLGGAALGTAFMGRRLIGNPMKMATQNQETRDAAINKFKWYKPTTYGKAASAAMGNVPHIIKTKKDIVDPNTGLTRKKTWGDSIMDSETKKGDIDHAKNVLNTKTKDMHLGDDYGALTGPQKDQIKEAIDKDLISRHLGYGGNYSNINDPTKKTAVDTAYSTGLHNTNVIKHNASHMEGDFGSSAAVGEFIGAIRKGTFDLRNLSQIKSTSKGLPMAAVGLVAAVAGGVRMGLKSGPNVDPGKGQGDALKDIGTTITEALKSVKIEVPKATSGGHGGGDAHAPAGGGHH